MQNVRLAYFWLLIVVLYLWMGQSRSVLAVVAPDDQIKWLSEMQDLHTSGLLESYEDNGDSKAYIFDQALAIIAFTQAGELEKAEKILTEMKDLQPKDKNNAWVECYDANDPNDDAGCDKYVTGPIAWMVIAINFYECRTGDPTYAPMAQMALNWLDTMRNIDPEDERYGSLRYCENCSIHNAISTEHNIDAYSAYYWRGMLDANDSYLHKASLIMDYLRNEMWAPSPNSNCDQYSNCDHDVEIFWEGYNDWAFATDCQSWGVLSLGPFGPDGEPFKNSLNWLLENPYGTTRTTQDYNDSIQDVNGFKSWVGYRDICDPNTWDPWTGDSIRVWVDGTEHVAAALLSIGDDANGIDFYNEMEKTVDANGGLVHSFCEVNPDVIRWPENYRYNYVASAAWHYFNEVRVNPFNLRPCFAECRAANINETETVNFKDFAILASQWLEKDSDLAGDINGDRRVQNVDLYLLAEYWLHDCQE